VMYTGQTAQSSQFQVLFTSMSCNSGADFSLPR
jgi:hypothetical protein